MRRPYGEESWEEVAKGHDNTVWNKEANRRNWRTVMQETHGGKMV